MADRRIDIAVCTYQRTHITETLATIAALEIPEYWKIRVIVADNDDVPSARETVLRAASEHGLDVHYIHAPARNISIARNACLDAAASPFLAFVDDDELLTPAWLWHIAQLPNLDQEAAVLGPVDAVYPEHCPDWVRECDFHSTRPVWVKEEILTGYSCNLVLNLRHPALKDLRFDSDYGVSGGEDTVFLSEVHRRGGHIAYAKDALILEPVPENRATFQWLWKRRYRVGTTHGMVLRKEMGSKLGKYTMRISLVAGKICICLCNVVMNIGNKARRNWWILRGVMHVGVLRALIIKM